MEKSFNSKWTLWYEERSKDLDLTQWGEQQKQVVSISNIKEFWQTFNNVQPGYLLPVNSMYHLFKENITPSWEDSNNTNGGSWRIPIRNRDPQIQDKWITLLMGVVGEQLDPIGNVICGASILVKYQSNLRLEIWLKEADDNVIATIGQRIRELRLLPESEKMDYIKHGEKDPYMTIV
ncbi:hypothetical protein WA158_002117 [Blastocystis sp. Blastoise]